MGTDLLPWVELICETVGERREAGVPRGVNLRKYVRYGRQQPPTSKSQIGGAEGSDGLVVYLGHVSSAGQAFEIPLPPPSPLPSLPQSSNGCCVAPNT